MTDAATGSTYYYNAESGESSWEDPTLAQQSVATERVVESGSAAAAEDGQEELRGGGSGGGGEGGGGDYGDGRQFSRKPSIDIQHPHLR